LSSIQCEATQAQAARREVLNDLVSGGLCIALAIVLAVFHYSQNGRLHDDFNRDPGPAFLPLILLAALGLAGVGMAIRGWLALSKTKSVGRKSATSVWPVIAAVIMMSAFLPLRDFVGAAPSLALVGALLAVLAGRDENSRWYLSAGVGAGVGLALYSLFHFGLSVPL
tara:strand:- start:182 stop:685 length:504 start_codon:yes stop_codon:yes gene_type:complete